jgi:sterol desaturase/sphingolipid hydroxylase (fatty acid hydroxylase superfamily)
MTLESKAQEESPIRLFESDFLEFFTHISPIVVLVIFIPVIGLFFWFGFTSNPGSGWWKVILAWLIGIVIWTPAEYTLHRFVFHFHPKTPSERVKRMLFLAHGVHHAQPREKTRLVMPPVLSIPLAALFYLFFWLFVGKLLGSPNLVNGIFAGFITGYTLYDMVHYSLHHFSFKSKIFRELRQHHMAHHFKTPDQLFGVTLLLWDRIFRTEPNA